MPPTGSIFTDWQQVEQEDRLFAGGDFDWTEPPRRRRRIAEVGTPLPRRRSFDEPMGAPAADPIRVTRRSATVEYEPAAPDGYASSLPHEEPVGDPSPVGVGSPDRPTSAPSHFDAMMAEWNATYGDGARRDADGFRQDRDRPRREPRRSSARAFDLSDPGGGAAVALDARRTVLITGHGDERYMPARRRAREAELRFHERAGFSPDRAGLWALLLGIALVIGAVVH